MKMIYALKKNLYSPDFIALSIYNKNIMHMISTLSKELEWDMK